MNRLLRRLAALVDRCCAPADPERDVLIAESWQRNLPVGLMSW